MHLRKALVTANLCIIWALYYPHVLPLALLDSLHPLAGVAFSPVVPVHSASTVALIAVPLTLIHIAWSVSSTSNV